MSQNQKCLAHHLNSDALQRKGRKVTVVSTLQTQPPMIADDLRRQADHFVDLATLAKKVGRDPSERAVRPAAPTRRPDADDDDDY